MGQMLNDIVETAGQISAVVILVWFIYMKIKVQEQDRRERLEEMKPDRIRQEARLKRKQEREKLSKPPCALPPPQQKQLRGRVKVALIVEKNDGE